MAHEIKDPITVIEESDGRWMSVLGEKLNGTDRFYHCRTYRDSFHRLETGKRQVVVIDRKKGYRTINLDRVKRIKSRRETYEYN